MSNKTFRVMPYMCKKQKEDLEQLLAAADDIGAAATSFSQGGQGYSQLIEARDKFKRTLMSLTTQYRIYQEEEEPEEV
jgi:hypothetical protein